MHSCIIDTIYILQRTPLKESLFIADNLAYFPYQVLDEPLFIIYHIDLMISTMGSNLLQSFREVGHNNTSVQANSSSSDFF